MRRRQSLAMPLALTVGALLVALLASAITTLSYLRGVRIAARQINQGQAAVAAVSRLVGDAESAERGYLLTGDEQYLQPWDTAQSELPGALSRLAGAVGGDPEQSRRVEQLRRLCDAKLAELVRAIELKRARQDDKALAVLRAERGEQFMDHQR